MTALTSRKVFRGINRSSDHFSANRILDRPGESQARQWKGAMVRCVRQLRIRQDFESMVSGLLPQLQAVAMHIVRHREDAEDAVQNALASAFAALDRFNGESSLETWIYRILVNSCLMKIRSRRHKKAALFSDLDLSGESLPATIAQRRHSSAEHFVETGEFATLLRKTIRGLPDPFRQILEMRDLQEIPTDEAAKALGLTEGAVRTRLHRARQALRKRLVSSKTLRPSSC